MVNELSEFILDMPDLILATILLALTPQSLGWSRELDMARFSA
jgi:hypothetical protein